MLNCRSRVIEKTLLKSNSLATLKSQKSNYGNKKSIITQLNAYFNAKQLGHASTRWTIHCGY